MLNTIGSQLRATAVLSPLNAANTGQATSAWVDVRGFEGPIAVIVQTGVVAAASSIAFTFNQATSAAGANSAAVVPLNGALVVVDPNNDPMTQVAAFDPATLGGWLQVVGTITGAGPALVAYSVVGVPKYNP